MDTILDAEIREALQKVCDRHRMSMADIVYRITNMNAGEDVENLSDSGLDDNDHGLPGAGEEGTPAGEPLGLHGDDADAAPIPGNLDQHALRGEE
jgi:hypothetical protein